MLLHGHTLFSGRSVILGNVNTEVRIWEVAKFNGSNTDVYIIEFCHWGFFSDEIINGAMKYIVLCNIKHR